MRALASVNPTLGGKSESKACSASAGCGGVWAACDGDADLLVKSRDIVRLEDEIGVVHSHFPLVLCAPALQSEAIRITYGTYMYRMCKAHMVCVCVCVYMLRHAVCALVLYVFVFPRLP